METATADVVIIGGGAAGLMAARTCARGGARVLLVEARDRLGGRIHTLREPDLPLWTDAGAEFIHGTPQSTWRLVRELGLVPYETGGDRWMMRDGRLVRSEGFTRRMKPLLTPMRERFLNTDHPDQSLGQFVSEVIDPQIEHIGDENRHRELVEAKEAALQFFEGFDAADPRDASARALAAESEGLGDIGSQPQFRMIGGYDGLIAGLAGQLGSDVDVRLSTQVHLVRWRAGHVEVEATDPAGNAITFQAGKAILTLPVGLLQAGAVRFEPDIPRVREAAAMFGTGPVVKAILWFDEPFWEQEAVVRNATGESGKADTFRRGAFWQDPHPPAREVSWPTWWTTVPLRAPMLTGWAGGPYAVSLTGRSQQELTDGAVRQIARLLGQSPDMVRQRLVRSFIFDWPADPLSRGAYSYERVGAGAAFGGRGARATLAEPIAGTLWFAGEASDTGGQASTVAGALASGERAASQVLDI